MPDIRQRGDSSRPLVPLLFLFFPDFPLVSQDLRDLFDHLVLLQPELDLHPPGSVHVHLKLRSRSPVSYTHLDVYKRQGLGSFNGNDIYTISDNVGPLLSGMKVAFHTSVYGIFFSLVFNFVYRSLMADAYGKMDGFLAAFRQCVLPQPVSERENSASMLVYQAGMADSMKKIMELLKGNACLLYTSRCV